MSSPCEWDPVNETPAGENIETLHGPATVCVGAGGQWHLCAECAALPFFKRFTARKPLRPPEVAP